MFRRILPVLVLCSLALLVTNGCKSKCGCKKGKTPHITTEELAAIIKESPGEYMILDARSEEYDDGNRIPGAKELSYKASEKQISSMLADKNVKIITYCSNPKCPASKKLAKRLKKLGYKNVKKYPDGIEGWIKAGQKIEKAKK